jgi:hypothetical protein
MRGRHIASTEYAPRDLPRPFGVARSVYSTLTPSVSQPIIFTMAELIRGRGLANR